MKRFGYRVLCFLLFLTSTGNALLAGGPNFALYSSYGYMWAHRKTMLPLEAPTKSIDASIFWFTEDQDIDWTSLYGSPRFGLNLTYLDLGTTYTGKAIGILPFIEFKLLNQSKQEFNFRLSTGLGYLTKKWGVDNLKNKAIGSHVNMNMRAHFVYHRMIGEHLELSALAGITHFSNSNFKMPNLGVNSVEFGVGLSYNRHHKPENPKSYVPKEEDKLRRHEFKLTGGTKETGLVYTKRILVGILGYRYHIWCGPRSRFNGGADIFYDQGYFYRDNPADAVGKPKLKDATEIGLTLAHDLILGKFHIVTEGGLYAYAPKWNNGLFYQRVGFKYEFSKQWLASLTLKTHFARADYLEWGIAYTILEH